MVEGMLFVNKPPGPTSHDVVEILRRQLGMKRIGHTGTLDPMAEGLLILLVGSATKHQHAFQTHEKTYEAVLTLGTQTDTGDATGTVVRRAPIPTLDRARIEGVLTSLEGHSSQAPPSYSAVKVQGRPAYWWARRRQPVSLSSRMIQVFELSLMACTSQTIAFRVRCSAGTYVRTLAEAIAQRLGTVGHLSALIRVRIGPWGLGEAKSLEWIAQASPELLARAILPVSVAASAPTT